MADRYEDTNKMCELIGDDYRLLQVISRFGLSLGFGEKTIAEVCQEQQVDCNTFLAVVNFTKCGDKALGNWTDRISVSSLTEYLRQAHSYFLEFQFPNIRRKLVEAIDCSEHNEVAFLILKFYDGYVAEVRKHMEHENVAVFAYVDELIAGEKANHISIEMEILHQDPIEQKMTELKNIIIKYYKIQGDANLLNSVLADIFVCEEDLRIHCDMEKNLFIPAVRILEEKVKEERFAADEEEENADVLSEREKEIIVWVVKGLTNKEIADRLFISINTVTTHRRNIAHKLDIHSPAGLTIYAIVNKLVDISDVEIGE
jgi:regulator of cell morphogenesis and NO signaling